MTTSTPKQIRDALSLIEVAEEELVEQMRVAGIKSPSASLGAPYEGLGAVVYVRSSERVFLRELKGKMRRDLESTSIVLSKFDEAIAEIAAHLVERRAKR